MAAENICQRAAQWSLLPVLLLLSCTYPVRGVTATDPTVADELKQLNDTTILRTHLSLDSEWNQYKDGVERASWGVNALWSWRASDCQDWAIRLNLPVDYQTSRSASDHGDVGGFGDVEVGVGTAFRLNDNWRTAGGIELHADTASDPLFAENVWRLKWGWGVAHDFSNWFSASLSADYNRSIAEEDNFRQHSYFESALPVTFIFPQNWSVGAKYRALIDFNNGDRWAHTVSASIAKRLTKVPIVLSASIQKAVSSSSKRFQVDVTIVYYFQRYHSPK
jgi:hypothetical protein